MFIYNNYIIPKEFSQVVFGTILTVAFLKLILYTLNNILYIY